MTVTNPHIILLSLALLIAAIGFCIWAVKQEPPPCRRRHVPCSRCYGTGLVLCCSDADCDLMVECYACGGGE